MTVARQENRLMDALMSCDTAHLAPKQADEVCFSSVAPLKLHRGAVVKQESTRYFRL